MVPFPNKKYDIIYADPPWAYEQKMQHSAASYHYPTMSTDAICALPVFEIVDTDCLLFLWVSSPNLPDALRVGEAWGFEFKQNAFVWDKQSPCAGNYTMTTCELCFVFKHGKIPEPRGKRNIPQFLSIKKGRHSEKPKQIRHRITEMFPTQSKIELFARPDWTDYDRGWDFWGNEVAAL